MRVVLCLSLLCSTVLFSMDELNQDASLDMHDPLNNARILSRKGILELGVATNLLTFYQEEHPDEYEKMLRHIQRRSKAHDEELLQALITAQQEHTKMLADQMKQTKEIADRSSVSTQKALQTAKLRLYVAGTAVGLTLISLTMNILQATNVIE